MESVDKATSVNLFSVFPDSQEQNSEGMVFRRGKILTVITVLFQVLENPRSQRPRMYSCPMTKAERLEASKKRQLPLREDLWPSQGVLMASGRITATRTPNSLSLL